MIRINYGLHYSDMFKSEDDFIEHNKLFIFDRFEEYVYENDIKTYKPIREYSERAMLKEIVSNGIWDIIYIRENDKNA